MTEATEALTALQTEWQTVRTGIAAKETARQEAEKALQELRQEGVAVTTRLNSLTAAINDTKRQREALLTRAAEAAEQLQHVRKQQRDRAAALATLQGEADALQAEETVRLAAKDKAAAELAAVESEVHQLEKERQRPLRHRADLEGRTQALRADPGRSRGRRRVKARRGRGASWRDTIPANRGDRSSRHHCYRSRSRIAERGLSHSERPGCGESSSSTW